MADTKDWTWVLERPCPECGFACAALERDEIATALRAANHRIVALLGQGDLVRERPAPDVWSALEYGCHVRDVNRLFLRRLRLMLDQDAPQFDNWDQDATAVESHYDRADVDEVVDALTADGERLAAAFAGVREEEWTRTGLRSDGALFTIESFGRYLVHDPVHHVWDVEQGYLRLS